MDEHQVHIFETSFLEGGFRLQFCALIAQVMRWNLASEENIPMWDAGLSDNFTAWSLVAI